MQEIALFLSSIAGACTAVAVKKFPKNKVETATIGANSQIKNQINSLRLEKEILTKTITRLYQNDAGLNKIQRDKLLLRYQHQLGIILTKIEKLEMASKHPDLGPVGEGLITLMDQKLSQLDKRLYELSSKITIANSQAPQVKTGEVKEEIKKEKPIVKPKEKLVAEKVEEKPQQKIIIPKIQAMQQLPRSVELTTLTELSNKHKEFPFFEQKPNQTKNDVVDTEKDQEKPLEKVEVIQSTLKPEVKPETPKPEIQTNLPVPQQNTTQTEQEKPQTSQKIPDEDKIEEDEDDLDKIKGEIMKTLSRLEQAEVE